jgi:hypothetical protein
VEIVMRRVVGIALIAFCVIALAIDLVIEELESRPVKTTISNISLVPSGAVGITTIVKEYGLADLWLSLAALAAGGVGLLCLLWPERRKVQTRTASSPDSPPQGG